jgi:hypothetical protein
MSAIPPLLVDQLSQSYATINYRDMNGNPYTPTAVSWRLYDNTNDLILQDWTAIAGPLSTSSTVTIPPTLNQLTNAASQSEQRVIIFQITVGSVIVAYPFQAYTVIAVPSLGNLA